ncbi:MAG TPA: DegT/DnrJ/EryC1/StrS family aminotransferase [Terriglobales bacterium]|nr:DegT/DnrJ/EryC1/StrS family aminotransferase [Terriglobales bacterium]
MSGRYGICQGLRAFGVGAGQRVLIPSYICRVAVEAIEAAGAAVDFYVVDEQLRPDYDDLVTRITPDTRAILVVHYFGFVQLMDTFREICSHHKLLLIEDAAHVFPGPWTNAGTVGDFTVFSWRKFLPVMDGSDLLFLDTRKTTSRKVPMGLSARSAKYVVDNLGAPDGLFARATAGAVRLLRGSRRPNSSDQETGKSSTAMESSSVEFTASLAELPATGASNFIRAHTDSNFLYESRRRNYAALARELHLRQCATRPLFPQFPSDVCPLQCPVWNDSPLFHRTLRQHGIPASAWEDVIPPNVDLEKFPAAKKLYNHLFFLPIHQGLDVEQVTSMAELISNVEQSVPARLPIG